VKKCVKGVGVFNKKSQKEEHLLQNKFRLDVYFNVQKKVMQKSR